MLKNTKIKDIAFSSDKVGSSYGGNESYIKYNDTNIDISTILVSYNFLDFFGIKVINGRNFTQSDEINKVGTYIMSKMVMDKNSITLGDPVLDYEKNTINIIGICNNSQITNMKTKLRPYLFFVQENNPFIKLENTYIKVSENSEEIRQYIKDCYKKTDPSISVEITYLTDEIEAIYTDENTSKQIMQAFSLIAIIIALVGVFGLVSFDTKYRRKEIGLRRINGATITNILSMFSSSYIKIMLISFVLSVPLVYYCISQWLEDFPYRIEIYWWVFALALLLVFVLTILISATQTISAAKKNPIESLKNE